MVDSVRDVMLLLVLGPAGWDLMDSILMMEEQNMARRPGETGRLIRTVHQVVGDQSLCSGNLSIYTLS